MFREDEKRVDESNMIRWTKEGKRMLSLGNGKEICIGTVKIKKKDEEDKDGERTSN